MEEKKNTVAAATPSNPTDKTAPAPSKKPEEFRGDKGGYRGERRPRRKRFEKPKSNFVEHLISINRVTKVTKGGRHFKFAALVVVGDKKGLVGFATGKANEVPDAIKKAINEAHKNLIRVNIVKNTIPHAVMGHHGASKVMIKPANKGVGIIAGGPARLALEASGIQDVYAKSFGSNTSVNMLRATFNGLKKIKTQADFDFLRDRLPVEPPKEADEQKEISNETA